jgi:hypothetical protein
MGQQSTAGRGLLLKRCTNPQAGLRGNQSLDVCAVAARMLLLASAQQPRSIATC